MSRIVLLLLKNELLRNARTNVILKHLFGNRTSADRVIRCYFVFAFLYFVLTSLLPVTNINISFNIVQGLAPYYHFVINGILALCLFFGLFVGANLIYNLNITENEQLLSLPLVIDDLVSYRLSDVVIANLKSHLLFFFPLFLYLFIAVGWSVYWVLLIAFLTSVLSLISYQIGILIMLLIAKKLPNQSSDKIFINGFLISIMLFVGFIRLFKSGYIGQGYTSIWTMLGDFLSSNSISVWIENIVVRPFGFPLYLLALSVSGILIYYLWKMSSQVLSIIYHKIHFTDVPVKANAKSFTYWINFENLNKFLHFIPLFPRIIIVKDILSLIRKPNLIIKIVIFTGGLILLSNLKSSYVDNPLLLGLYFSSWFVITRLYIGIVGAERSNIINIKLLAPSIAKYLSARIQNTILITFIVLIPLWVLLVSFSGNVILLSNFHRILFLILNVLFGSILVIFYSASFAEFESSNTDNSYTGINSVAMLLFWSIGLIFSLFFYELDKVMSSEVYNSISMFIILLMGLFLFICILLFSFLGIRRIKNYY